ncbi:MAG: 4Fe-4S dicluster domain-containing protein [Nitrospirota bacterium]
MNTKKHTTGRIIILSERCKGCGLCIPACPKGLIVIGNDFNEQGFHPAVFISENDCTGCTLCAVSCPDLAIEVYKQVGSHES